jgi:hypothetical protein
VAFSRQFGELDDMTPHLTRYSNGYRLKRLEFFDVSNLNYDGNLAPPDSINASLSKVKFTFSLPYRGAKTGNESLFESVSAESPEEYIVPCGLKFQSATSRLFTLPSTCSSPSRHQWRN